MILQSALGLETKTQRTFYDAERMGVAHDEIFSDSVMNSTKRILSDMQLFKVHNDESTFDESNIESRS